MNAYQILSLFFIFCGMFLAGAATYLAILDHRKPNENWKFADGSLQPLLTYDAGLEPKFEDVDEMGFDESGNFYVIQSGPGGGKRGLICGRTDKSCRKYCCQEFGLFFSRDNKPLFFCRYYYCVIRGYRFVEQTSKFPNLDILFEKTIHPKESISVPVKGPES